MTAVLWFLLLLAALGGAGVAWGIRDARDNNGWLLPSLRVLRLRGNRSVVSHEDVERHNHERGES